MATLLATVVTIYLVPGLLLDKAGDAASTALAVGAAWLGHFIASCVMLAIVVAGYRRTQRGAGPTPVRLAILIFASGNASLFIYAVVIIASNERVNDAQDIAPFGGLLLWNYSLAALIVLAHHFAERSRRAASALGDAEMRRIGLEREVASARLALLQAQVEPHFIFNALANVRRLMRTDADAARALLTDLLRYLEEALPALRDELTSLGREAALVRAYLAVHQVRMGSRLRSDVDVPDELAGRSVPPMVLLTLVENALKHGLQPMVEGGSITVRARSEAGRIVLTVADTGRGMGSGSGHGTGLANVRARLKQMYGAEASLALAVNEPRGVIATITLPDGA
ncbi:MAG TPA: histidine kinase [Burkholderiaceae bacterium]|nr:histidine kinase [Burkholderiaceae bacterium]